MQMVRYSIALVFAAVALIAQKPGSVRGQVASVAGAPLRKAEVILRSTGTTNGQDARVLAATTDGSGVFFFENVAPGKYIISAQRNGFVRQDSGPRRGAAPAIQGISVAEGQDVTGISIKLTPHSVITGKVTDEDSEPMFGATVSIMEERYTRGRRTLAPRANVVVNDLGEYRIAGLQPGRYYLAVEPRNEWGSQVTRARQPGEETERSFVTVYFPGVVDQIQATPINLEPGQEARGIDVQVRKSPTVHIRGHVLDDAGNPISNTAVMLMSGENPTAGMGGKTGSVRPDGSFDIAGVPPGNHVLMANRITREQARSVGILNVQVGARDVNDVVLRMSSPAQITGVVKAPENPDLTSVRVTLDPIESFPFDMHSSRNMQEGNAFTIPDITPGKYRIDVYGAPEGYYLRSAQVNGQDVTDSGLTVTGSMAGVEVTLVKGATTVDGTVSDADGKPLGQSLIALVPPSGKRDQWRLFKTSMADQNGRFTFRNLSPGEYTLFAFQPGGDTGAVQNPEYLKQIESKGTVVKLGENARESVQLKVID